MSVIEILYWFFQLKGMSTLYTIVVLAAIRCKSIVEYDRSWNLVTHESYWTIRYVKIIWGLSFLIAIPPMFGLGSYKLDVGGFRYQVYVISSSSLTNQ